MSDTGQGPGWWEASDGKWYPPESHPEVRHWLQSEPTQSEPTQAEPAEADASESPPPTPGPAQAWGQATTFEPSHGWGPAPISGPAQGWTPSKADRVSAPVRYEAPSQPAQYDPWTQTGATPPPVQGPLRSAHKPLWQRPLPVAIVIVIVAAAISVPLALRSRSTPSFSASPAATILSKVIANASTASSFDASFETQNGSQSVIETLDVGRTGGSIDVRTGNPTYQLELVGSTLYLRGSAAVLVGYGVSAAQAARYSQEWVSMPATASPATAVVRSLVTLQGETGLLALANVTKMATRPEFVELRGELPKSPLLATSAAGTEATLNVSTTAPYWPLQLYFSESGILVTLTYSHWGTAAPISAPRPAEPIGALLASVASGTRAEQAILQSISLRPSDLAKGYGVQLIPSGDQLKGQVTLDLCNQTFASEHLRIARRQVEDVGPTPQASFLSTEAVIYTSPAATATVFSELRSAAAHCAAGYVIGPLGPPANMTTLLRRPDASWPSVPGVQRLAYDQKIATVGKPSFEVITVFLRRGRVLLGVYFEFSGKKTKTLPTKIDGLWSLELITHVFEERVAALPPSAVR